MGTQVIVINGGSSSGKTTIARCLQELLPGPWLRLGVDDLIKALPESGSGISFGSQGEVIVDDTFHAVEAAWMTGVAAMARAGARIIFDDVFLSGGVSQQRMRARLDGLDVLWVGVRCDPDVARSRELARGDRITGMAASQATIVHEGVRYDFEVDSTQTSALNCAKAIATHV